MNENPVVVSYQSLDLHEDDVSVGGSQLPVVTPAPATAAQGGQQQGHGHTAQDTPDQSLEGGGGWWVEGEGWVGVLIRVY